MLFILYPPGKSQQLDVRIFRVVNEVYMRKIKKKSTFKSLRRIVTLKRRKVSLNRRHFLQNTNESKKNKTILILKDNQVKFFTLRTQENALAKGY